MSVRTWILRALLPAGAVTVAVLTTAGAAAAFDPVPLHSSHRNLTAASFSSQSCDQIPGGAKVPGKDGWVFVLPHNDADFVTLSLLFRSTGGQTITVTIPNASDSYPDGITTNGTSKAWVVLPSGWTLLDGSATVSGETRAQLFNLTHTCPGTTTIPSPSSSSVSGSPSQSTSASGSPSGSGSASTEGTPPASPDTTPPPSTPAGGGGGLPRTGVALGGFLLTGAAAIAIGAALLMLRRRREVTFAAE